MINSILIITAFPPNQRTAGQDYTRRLILDLVGKNYKVDLIYAKYPNHEVELPDCVNIVKIIYPNLYNCIRKFWIHPFFSKRYDKKIFNYIKEISGQYDLLYFDFSQVHIYSMGVEHPCKVAMCHDVISQKYSRKAGKLNIAWIKHWEAKLLRNVKYGVTFSEKDSDIIKTEYSIETMIVNFYLKSDRFIYDNDCTVTSKFCFYGAWNRKENIESLEYFIEKIYPKIRSKNEYIVIGGGMDAELCKKIDSIKEFSYIGFVDDPVRCIAECQALIALLHQGAGVKVKVVDALTSGTPVIGTGITFEGISDNQLVQMFYKGESNEDFVSLIDNWKLLNKEKKQSAANEFFERYNTKHFTELIPRIEK